MAILDVPDQKVRLGGLHEIGQYLAPYGIWYERWELSDRRLSEQPTEEEILAAYDSEIGRAKDKGGYLSADVICVTPETPGLEAMLAKFDKEHTHSEDEVRFVVHGSGIFHINPVSGPIFSIEMEAGDLINVPAGTKHWFNLCLSKTITAIRLFKDVNGWLPEYIEASAHKRYEPVCFGRAFVAHDRDLKRTIEV